MNVGAAKNAHLNGRMARMTSRSSRLRVSQAPSPRLKSSHETHQTHERADFRFRVVSSDSWANGGYFFSAGSHSFNSRWAGGKFGVRRNTSFVRIVAADLSPAA